MIKRISIIFILLLAAGPALAASWDSNANISQAMDKAVSVFKENGIEGNVSASQNCYSGLDIKRTNPYAARDLEYCISFEMSSLIINNKVSGGDTAAQNPYFKEIVTRTGYYLEKAHVVELPEQYDRYIMPRLKKIQAELPEKL